MKSPSIQKHVTLYPSHVDVLDSIIANNADINNYSEAIRFLCMSYQPDTNTTTASDRAKLNAIGKELSILTEMVAEFADLHLKKTGVLIGTKSSVYKEVKEKVEKDLNPSNRHRPYAHREQKPDVDPFDPRNLLKR